jgi:hypothetical protein
MGGAKEYEVAFMVRMTKDEVAILDDVALRIIIADAFGEFVSSRCGSSSQAHLDEGSARAYVDKRYPEAEYLALDRDSKVKKVIQRNRVARLLHAGGLRGVTVRLVEE